MPTRDFFRSLSRCHHGSCHLRWTRSSPFSAVAILAQGVGDLPSALEATSQKEKAYIRFASALQMPSMRQASHTPQMHYNALNSASVTYVSHPHYKCTRCGKRYTRSTPALHMHSIRQALHTFHICITHAVRWMHLSDCKFKF